MSKNTPNTLTQRRHDAHGFPPISAPDAQVLILGSMPGIPSLDRQEYYAHPRNAFWNIMRNLFNVTGDYSDRCRQLTMHKIAVWDALKFCTRKGSLDSNIDNATLVTNDFQAFLEQHPRITHIFFNGGKAEESFKKHALPQISQDLQNRLVLMRLPSTSPAMAQLNLEGKIEQWRLVSKVLDKT